MKAGRESTSSTCEKSFNKECLFYKNKFQCYHEIQWLESTLNCGKGAENMRKTKARAKDMCKILFLYLCAKHAQIR